MTALLGCSARRCLAPIVHRNADLAVDGDILRGHDIRMGLRGCNMQLLEWLGVVSDTVIRRQYRDNMTQSSSYCQMRI
jgi:hypothetical protein